MLFNKRKLFLSLAAVAMLSACSDRIITEKKLGLQKPTQLKDEEKKAYEVVTGNRQLKVIELDNKLQAVLISDPGASNSSASMDVAVGQYSNPIKYRGLAHYLEHMLFLGTKKDPVPDTFMDFVKKNGGGTNAYTSAVNTNYFFAVNDNAFDEALGSFSHFFIDPLFLEEYVPKELEAVDSEYQKNRLLSDRRWYYLNGYLSDEGSPERNNFQGSVETLGTLPREELLGFYKKYYSANQMKLSVISKLPLDELEKLVREKFAAVPNSDAPTLTYPASNVADSNLPRQLEFKASDNKRMLYLSFELPSTESMWAENPLVLIKAAFNFGGPGSLRASLKAKGLVNMIEADEDGNSALTRFLVVANLTEEGSKRYKEVVREIFASLKQLRIRGLDQAVYEDAAQLAKLTYIYGTPIRGTSVHRYSTALKTYGPENLEGKMFLISKYDPELYASLLAKMTPERMVLTLGAPEIKGEKKADFYDIEYNLRQLAQDPWIQELKNVEAASYALLEKNPFVPTDMSMVDQTGQKARLLQSNEYGALWLAPSIFSFPKTDVRLTLVKPEQEASKHNEALSSLYSGALNDMVTEWSDLAQNAGFEIKISSGQRSTEIQVNGFSEKMGDLVSELAKKIRNLQLSQENFALLQQKQLDGAKVALSGEPLERVRDIFRSYINPHISDLSQWVSEIPNVTLAELNEHIASSAAQASLDMAVIGNASESSAKEMFASVAKNLGAAPILPKDRKPYHVEVELPEGRAYGVSEQGNTNNHAWRVSFMIGKTSPTSTAITQLADSYFGQSFFTKMRTKEGLGYVAQSAGGTSRNAQWLIFMIQGAKFNPDQIAAIALPWIREQAALASEMSDKDFEDMKAAVVLDQLKPPNQLAEEVAAFRGAIDVYDGNFSFSADNAEAIRKVTKAEFARALQEAVGVDTQKSISVYLNASGSAPSVMEGQIQLINAANFKQALPKLVKPIAH